MRVEGECAWVSGGASGLGAATVRALVAAGARVGIFDRAADQAAALADELGAAQAVALVGDVTDAASAALALATLTDRFGAPRVLVTCAGVADPGRAVGREGPLDLAQFEKVVRINLIGSFNLVRLAAHAMRGLPAGADGARGVIVMTASIAAFDGQVGQPAYAASKGGVTAMTLPLAREFAPVGVRVITIAPGIFATPMLTSLPEEVQRSLGAAVPYPSRLGDPAEFARLVLHAIDNQMLNGEVIRLDGAIRMAPR
jgi:NAD(P)-dependent dehydrogenase (short-subunit alcohol dehydrogenase family)